MANKNISVHQQTLTNYQLQSLSEQSLHRMEVIHSRTWHSSVKPFIYLTSEPVSSLLDRFCGTYAARRTNERTNGSTLRNEQPQKSPAKSPRFATPPHAPLPRIRIPPRRNARPPRVETLPHPAPPGPGPRQISRNHATHAASSGRGRVGTFSPSCTSSPAARSPKTCANRHSRGCGCGCGRLAAPASGRRSSSSGDLEEGSIFRSRRRRHDTMALGEREGEGEGSGGGSGRFWKNGGEEIDGGWKGRGGGGGGGQMMWDRSISISRAFLSLLVS